MKRILLLLSCLILAIPSYADGLQYLNHCKSLYNSGRYEEAKQGFTLCKVYNDVNSADMDAWIAKCDQAIEAKKNKAAAAAKKLAAERQAAYEESQRQREENNLIYISTNARTIDSDYPSMQSAIKGKLQQFHFSKKEDDARWGVYVSANAREQQSSDVVDNSTGARFVYAEGILQVIDLLTGEIYFEQEYSEKFATTNLVMAVKKAYSRLIDSISTDILNIISQ